MHSYLIHSFICNVNALQLRRYFRIVANFQKLKYGIFVFSDQSNEQTCSLITGGWRLISALSTPSPAQKTLKHGDNKNSNLKKCMRPQKLIITNNGSSNVDILEHVPTSTARFSCFPQLSVVKC